MLHTVLKVVGNESQRLDWPDHGFYLQIPDGALPPEKTAEVNVTVILDGQFVLPPNSQLISGLFFITSTRVFLKEVAVYVQHSAAIRSREECSKFSFIIANGSESNIPQPYRFVEKKGTFKPDNQYGRVILEQLDSVMIIGQTAPPTTALYCTSFVFYKPIHNTDDVEFHFVVIRNLDYLVKVYIHVHVIRYPLLDSSVF